MGEGSTLTTDFTESLMEPIAIWHAKTDTCAADCSTRSSSPAFRKKSATASIVEMIQTVKKSVLFRFFIQKLRSPI